ncbi:hypothetical protein Bbelb_064190 [Branchiostoma belcheri]|nr:hypothetical protein Bbelb_064190 [Branchiostoma belcheri]
MGCEEFDEELEKCIQEASLNDIVVVCSASNEGRRSSNTILFPARFGNVISVGSHDYLGHASNFTAVGREIDILGPGKLRSACPDHKTKVTNATSGATGTSFAAPFVAGIVAIILANAQRIGGPSLRQAISNNVVMKQILREMASEPGDHTQSRGHGSLDPLRIFYFEDDFFRQIVRSITSTPQQGEDHKLRNYDLRKVATDMIHSDQLLQDVEFASTIESIILRLEQAEEGGMPSPMGYEQWYHQYPDQNINNTPSNQPKHLNLKVFRDKITADEVRKISCLSLPSPSDAAYGDTTGSAALTEFLTQLGDDLVRSVEDLWLKGTETKLTIEDIKEILQALRAPKSASTSQLTLTVHYAVFKDKKGVEALKAVLDKTAQVNNLLHLWCGGTEDKPLEWQHLTEILQHIQENREATLIPLNMHFYQIKELKGNLSDISNKMQNLNANVIIHHSAAVCAWRQQQGLRVGKELEIQKEHGGIVTVEACRPGCNSTRKEVVSAEDMACDIISCDNPTSRDGAAALRATIKKHAGDLKEDVHVTVAVLGSGVYIDHKDVTQIIKDKACFVPQESWDLSVDTRGTGTALASIATSFAPAQTRLLTAKVMDEQGRSNPVWVARAVDWAANHHSYPADVILIPVGFERFDHRLYKAVTEAQKNGKIVIAAAAHNTEAREISYPARHGDVICVGSHSSFGVKGREMDFLMMGEHRYRPVKAAPAKGRKKYSSMSGTSVATAMATAVVGLTLLYAESVGGKILRDQLKSNTMIRELLREACSSRGFHTPDRGYGTLDPDRLFKWGPQHFKELVKKIAGT